jgi:hypothetical protein
MKIEKLGDHLGQAAGAVRSSAIAALKPGIVGTGSGKATARLPNHIDAIIDAHVAL